ncbi:hypothetical protein RND81_11G128700 [Saponaria officinalis]|uniref:Fatty acid desaturase domain-containing protein n=1 Tax=Saponaria officinalis TaxID=3572 RepID=A0AAW1HLG0_SAPOF
MAPPLASSPSKTRNPTKQLNHDKFSHDDEPKLSQEKDTKSYKIWLSNVVVKKPNKNKMEKKKWHVRGIRRLIVMIIVHGLTLFAPLTFNWGAFWVAVLLHVISGLGITLSFHRNLTHKSFTLVKWVEYLFAYFGSLALQGDPIGWVRTHRYHHKFVDSERDPHSPLEGFWYSHIYWIFDTTTLARKRGGTSIVKDLETQEFYKFMRSTYILHHVALTLLLYALGGFSYVVWGMGVRLTCVFHTTFSVNSVCHVWGNQAWNTGDLSKNNWWAAIFTGGEGWHNNHHAFEYSARHGLEWWQIDLTWYIIKFLETIGLAKDVKLPTQAHLQRMAFNIEAS